MSGPLINWGLLLLLLKLMDNLNNKLQLLKEEDGIKKNKKKISRTSSSSSNSCVNSTSGKIKSPTSSGNSGSKEGGGGVMKLSTDPQSVAARQRRHRISERFKMLQSLIPGGSKMDTVSMLEEAIHYVNFLKTQLWLHQTIMMNINDLTDIHQHDHEPISSSPSDIDQHLFLNSIMNFNSSDSSPTTNPHVNNMINNMSLSSSPPPPPVQYPPQQFLYSSSSSSTSSSTTTTTTCIPAAGISAGMAPLPPTPTTTFPPVFCYDHQDDDA